MRINCNSGFLIIELLLAVLLASMAFVFLGQLLNRSVRLQHDSAWEIRAAEFGNDVMAHIRAEAMQAGRSADSSAWAIYWDDLDVAYIPLALGGKGEYRAWGQQSGIESNAALIVTNGERHPVQLAHKGYNAGLDREPFILWYELKIEPAANQNGETNNVMAVQLNLYKEEDRPLPRVNYYAEITRN